MTLIIALAGAQGIVIDPDSERYGQIADITSHSMDAGIFYARFGNKEQAVYCDGMLDDEYDPPGMLRIDHLSPARILELKIRVEGMRGMLQQLGRVVDNKKFPLHFRRAAMNGFRDAVGYSESRTASSCLV